MPRRLFVVLILAASYGFVGARCVQASNETPPPPPPVDRIVRLAQSDLSRPVSYRFLQSYEVHVGRVFSETQQGAFVLASQGDQTVAARAIELKTNGHDASPDEQRKAERDFTGPSFHEPFDPRYAAEYTYTPEGTSVGFRALVRDGQHGDGTFETDAQGHVTTMTYTPCVYPQGASAGTVTLTRAEVAPGYWGLRSMHVEYTGRRFLVSGRFVLDATVADVRLYPTVAEAVEAVKSVDRSSATR